MRDQCLGVHGNTEINGLLGCSSVDAGLNRHHNIVRNTLFRNNCTDDIIRDTGSDIDDLIRQQFRHCSAANHLPLCQRNGFHRLFRSKSLSGIRGVVVPGTCLAMVFQRVVTYDNSINQYSGDHNFFRAERPCFYDPLHLYDDLSAPSLRGHNCRKNLQNHRLVRRADIPVFIGKGAPDQQSINRNLLVLQILFSINGYKTNLIISAVLRFLVHLSAFDSRINICTDSDLGQLPRFFQRHAVEHICHLSLRQIERLDLISGNQVHHPGRLSPVASDHTFQKSFVREMRHSTRHTDRSLPAGMKIR